MRHRAIEMSIVFWANAGRISACTSEIVELCSFRHNGLTLASRPTKSGEILWRRPYKGTCSGFRRHSLAVKDRPPTKEGAASNRAAHVKSSPRSKRPLRSSP